MSKKQPDPLAIDIDSLDEDWIAQPTLFRDAADLAADASEAKDLAKNQVEKIKATLDYRARTDESVKLELGGKLTEASIVSWIVIQPEYQEALTDYVEAKTTYNKASNIIRELEHRKAALENLVSLWQGSYFSSPKQEANQGSRKEVESKSQRKRLRK